MPIMTNTNLQNILDKTARFATESVGDPEFSAGFNAGMETASNDVLSGSNSIAQYVMTTADEDVMADLLPAARDLDETHPVPPDSFLINIKGVNALLTALDTHFKRYGFKGVDDYLTSINASATTLRAHGHFKKYLGKLSAKNSFIPTDLDIASFAVTGATAGTYAHANTIDTSKYGGAKLVVRNVGALNSTTTVTITAKKLNGTSVTLTATVNTLTDTHETNLSDTAKDYIDVTAISISGGTSGDHFKIVAKTDRDISAA